MKDIFKNRKIPRHLIIQDDYRARKKPRFSLVKALFWALLLASISYLVVVIR